jgi:hypothetical protein
MRSVISREVVWRLSGTLVAADARRGIYNVEFAECIVH